MNTSILVLVLLIIAVVLIIALRRSAARQPEEGLKICKTTGGLCCGGGEACIHKNLERASEPITYFDDEELDRFAGRDAGSYGKEEVGEFGYILDTLPAEETQAWLSSLSRRSITPPREILQRASARLSTTVH